VSSSRPRPQAPGRTGKARRLSILALAAALALCGCGSVQISSWRVPWFRTTEKVEEPVDLIVVMPVERSIPPSGGADEVDRGAEGVVTAAIYGVLSGSYEWRFVADMTTADAMQGVDSLASSERQAVALGKALEADAVIQGSVWRFIERIGSPDEIEQAASVGFTLRLVSVSSGDVVWEDSYERTQRTKGTGFFSWMAFWDDPPHWMTAAELTNEGVAKLMQGLRRRLR